MIAANQVGPRLRLRPRDNALTVYWPGGELAPAASGRARPAANRHDAERYARAQLGRSLRRKSADRNALRAACAAATHALRHRVRRQSNERAAARRSRS